MTDQFTTHTQHTTPQAADHVQAAPPHSGLGITARQLHKTYRTGARHVHALRGLDLHVQEAGFFGIMGPSGSGKTTLLHLLAGLDRPDEGEINVAGIDVHTLNERALTTYRRKRIGIIFQRFNLLPNLSALQNVTLPAMLDGIGREERTQRGMELLTTLGLADRSHHRPDALSGGEQQRVAIARALFFEPSVLFADEPTGNLDSQTGEQFWRTLRGIAEQRKLTVLMVTHEPQAAAQCSMLYLLRDGQIIESFNPEDMDAGELALRAQHVGR